MAHPVDFQSLFAVFLSLTTAVTVAPGRTETLEPPLSVTLCTAVLSVNAAVAVNPELIPLAVKM